MNGLSLPIMNGLSPPIMNEVFQTNDCPYDLRNPTILTNI